MLQADGQTGSTANLWRPHKKLPPRHHHPAAHPCTDPQHRNQTTWQRPSGSSNVSTALDPTSPISKSIPPRDVDRASCFPRRRKIRMSMWSGTYLELAFRPSGPAHMRTRQRAADERQTRALNLPRRVRPRITGRSVCPHALDAAGLARGQPPTPQLPGSDRARVGLFAACGAERVPL